MKLTKSKLEQLIKEEVNKYQLEEYEETAEIGIADFDQLVATWDTSIDQDGNPSWKKKHKSESALSRSRFRKAFVTLDLPASKWHWVVFESRMTRDEDIVDDDIGQGAEASLRDAILAADKVLTTGQWEY